MRLALQYWLARRRNPTAALGRYLDTPPPHLNQDFREASYLAVDLEMSALKPQEGEILSIGYVPIKDNAVVLKGARHLLLRSRQGVGQSATIHGLHDRDLAAGMEPEAALEEWLGDQAGKVLIAHHARLDLRYLNYYCQTLFGSKVPMLHLDTMRLERQRLDLQGQALKNSSLRLDSCRQRYKLPRYRAHNALTDAVATAELFLAQASHIAGDGRLSLKALMPG